MLGEIEIRVVKETRFRTQPVMKIQFRQVISELHFESGERSKHWSQWEFAPEITAEEWEEEKEREQWKRN